MASRAIDTVITFRVLKLLTMKWTDHEAYKIGIIDKKGKRNKEVDIDTKDKKEAYTFLHRLVFNLKKIIAKVPFGKTQFASYAIALLLLKEEAELDNEQGEELYEKFYRYLKEQELLTAETISESINVGKLIEGETYKIRFPIKEQGEMIHQHKDEVYIVSEYEKIYGIQTYIGYANTERVLVTADDVY